MNIRVGVREGHMTDLQLSRNRHNIAVDTIPLGMSWCHGMCWGMKTVKNKPGQPVGLERTTITESRREPAW